MWKCRTTFFNGNPLWVCAAIRWEIRCFDHERHFEGNRKLSESEPRKLCWWMFELVVQELVFHYVCYGFLVQEVTTNDWYWIKFSFEPHVCLYVCVLYFFTNYEWPERVSEIQYRVARIHSMVNLRSSSWPDLALLWITADIFLKTVKERVERISRIYRDKPLL